MADDKTYGIELRSRLDGKGFKDLAGEQKKVADDAQREAEKFRAEWTSAFREIRNISALAFAGISAGLGLSVHEAAQGEQAMVRLRSSVNGLSADVEGFLDRADDTAGALQRISGIADDQYISSLARMVAINHDAEGSLNNLGLVSDVARHFQIDLAAATDIVARAMVGEVGRLGMIAPALAQHIMDLDETATNAEKAAIIMESLSDAQGATADEATTLSTNIGVAKEETLAIAEAIGNSLTPALAEVITGFTEAAGKTREWIEENQLLTSTISISAISITGLVTVSAGLVTVWPVIVKGYIAAQAAMSVTTGLITFQTAALWGNSLAWNAVGYALLSINPTVLAVTAALGIAGGLALAIMETGDNARTAAPEIQTLTDNISALGDATAYAQESLDLEFIKQLSDAIARGEKIDFNWLTGAADEAAEEVKASFRGITPAKLKDIVKPIKVEDVFEIGGEKVTIPFGMAMPDDERAKLRDAIKHDTEEGNRIVHEGAVQLAIDKRDAEERWQEQKQALDEAEVARYMNHLATLRAAHMTFVTSLANSEMTGKRRREMIWDSMKQVFLRQIAEETEAFIFGQLAKQAAMEATVAVAATTTATTNAMQNQSTIFSLLKLAPIIAAKVISFYAALGPFAIPAAAGTIAAIWAFIRAARMQTGGEVGGTGRGDRVPTLLEPGEIVIRREVAQANRASLLALNSGQSMSSNPVQVNLQFYAAPGMSETEVLRYERMLEADLPHIINRAYRSGRMRRGG